MVCIWMEENVALAARMDTFDPNLPMSHPRLWMATRFGATEGWRAIDFYQCRRELQTEMRISYLNALARTAELGNDFESACAAFAAGARPWRGEMWNGDWTSRLEWRPGDGSAHDTCGSQEGSQNPEPR